MAAASARPRLEMRGVEKRFGATVALAGVDLAVAAGEVVALVGENGAGKSTLMKVLAGALAPDAGSMWLDGRPWEPRSPADGRAAGIAMIYQELSLAPHLSVADNVVLGAEPARGPLLRRGAARESARAALARVGLADVDLDRPVRRLGTAERQLVEIARALAPRDLAPREPVSGEPNPREPGDSRPDGLPGGARVLVLDEPTSSLGSAEVERLFGLIRALKADGAAIVYISHFLEELERVADRYVVLRDGATVGGGDPAHASHDEIVAQMVGRTVDELYPRSDRTPGEVVLEVVGLAGRRFEGAELELRRGEVLGIAGLVGAGRTELLRAISGLDPVRAGTVRVAGLSGPADAARAWAAGLGLVSEDRAGEGLALDLSIARNLTLPRLDRLGRFGFVRPSAEAAASARWIEALGVTATGPSQRVRALSGGNQQKVALARLLYADVDVLLLDEPTRGVDVGAKAAIYRWIDRLAVGDPAAGIAPKAVLVVSSYLPELVGIADRVAVMRRGRLGTARPVGERSEEELLYEATGSGITVAGAGR